MFLGLLFVDNRFAEAKARILPCQQKSVSGVMDVDPRRQETDMNGSGGMGLTVSGAMARELDRLGA